MFVAHKIDESKNEKIFNLLPNVGDVVRRTIISDEDGVSREHGPYNGVVTYVNRGALWYMVEFDLIGGKLRQCYKI